MKKPLSAFIREYSARNKNEACSAVYSVTNSHGFMPSTEYFSKEVFSKDLSAYKIVKKGMIAYNPSRINVGSVAVQRAAEQVIVSPLYVVFEVNEKELLPEYVSYFLHSDIGLAQIAMNTLGSVRDSLKFNALQKIEINVYSVEEQRRVVDKLQRLEAISLKKRKVLEKFEDLVKSQFIEMFGDPETNPYDFEKVAINDVCSSIVRGPFGSALKKDFFIEKSNNSYKVYEQKHAIQKSATIGTYYIDELKFKELSRFECKPGDFIMSCSGTMGELYQLPKDCERGIINQALCKFTLNDKISPVFFTTYMSQTIGNLETKGSGIKNIAAVSYVKSMPVILPPLEIQNQFARFVEQTDKSKIPFEMEVAA